MNHAGTLRLCRKKTGAWCESKDCRASRMSAAGFINDFNIKLQPTALS